MKDIDKVMYSTGNASGLTSNNSFLGDDLRFTRVTSIRKSYKIELIKLLRDQLTDQEQFDVGEQIVKLLESLELKLIVFNFENAILHSKYQTGSLRDYPELFQQLYRPCFIYLIASILSYSDSILIGIITKEKVDITDTFFRYFLGTKSYEHFADRFVILENSYELIRSLPKELFSRNRYLYFECFKIFLQSKFNNNIKLGTQNILLIDDDSNCLDASMKTINDGFFAFFSVENCLAPNFNLNDVKRYLEVEMSNRQWL